MPKLNQTNDEPDNIDRHAGLRLRELRTAKGWSQETLGGTVGISFQQIQKYERGTNRISLSRAWRLCKALGVPVSSLYAGLPETEDALAASAGVMAWAITERGLRWIALGQRISPTDFPTVAAAVALIVRED